MIHNINIISYKQEKDLLERNKYCMCVVTKLK